MARQARDIESINEQLRREPTSKQLLEEFLSESFDRELVADPWRIAHVTTYVRNYPRSSFARCPYAQICPEDSAEGFRQVEREWLTHSLQCPADAEIARGFALFVANQDTVRALAILRAVEALNGNDAELYVDIGRIDQSPRTRLLAFQRALELGGTQPNLRVWIAQAAVAANDLAQAERSGQELLALVDEARAFHGDRLDWSERGVELWDKVNRVVARSATHDLVTAIGDHAHKKHWGRTALGVVAVRRGDIDSAKVHLKESAAVVGEPRLSSYGLSFRLARELLNHGEWDAVTAYLKGASNSGKSQNWTRGLATLARGQSLTSQINDLCYPTRTCSRLAAEVQCV
jgi:hypothetical protein